MARLRFPGRPGCRFDRLGVRYGADEARNDNDPITTFVANIHRGLRLFKELVGDSDEDEEFEGFTKEDLAIAEKKLRQELAKCEKSSDESIASPVSSKSGTRLSKTRESLENLPSSERTRNRKSTLIRKSYKEMLQQGIATPTKSYSIMKAKEYKSARSETKRELKKWQKKGTDKLSDKQVAYKKFKIRLDSFGKVGKIVRGKGRPPKLRQSTDSDKSTDISDIVLDKIKESSKYEKHRKKERDKSHKVISCKVSQPSSKQLAKQLLQKAKTGRKEKTAAEQPVKIRKAYPRKQFILPTQSSRSSRVIIPNKRFLEDDSINELHKVTKKAFVQKENETVKEIKDNHAPMAEGGLFSNAALQLNVIDKVPTLPLSSLSPTGMAVPIKPQFDVLSGIGGFQSPLYDQPLIVEGKRARKPSLKVRMKLSDTSYKKFKARSFEKKLEARKVIEQEKLRQKQEEFNQDTKKIVLSPSKLSPSLSGNKLPLLPIVAPPKFGVSPFTSVSERERLEKLEREALVTRMRGHNILRKAKFQLNRAALNRSKADLARTLKKELKKEAKLEKIRQKQETNSVSALSTENKDGLLGTTGDEILEKKFHCSVCERGMRLPSRMCGAITCENCRKFYKNYKKRIERKKIAVCNNAGDCQIHFTVTMCMACRFKKCQKEFQIGPGRVTTPDNLTTDNADLTSEINITADDTEPVIIVDNLPQSVCKSLVSPAAQKPVQVSYLSPTASTVVNTTSSPDTDDSPKSDGRGPRIKHVCRKAAVVLGKPVAKFPSKSGEITLSALPSGEKVKLWKKDQATKKDFSDDEMSMEEIIQKSEDSFSTVKKTPVRSPTKSQQKGQRLGKRKIRCKKCEGCTSEDCGVCVYCLDKPKFGGRGVMKQACVERKCREPRYSHHAISTVLSKKGDEPDNLKDTTSTEPNDEQRESNQGTSSQDSRNKKVRGSTLSVIQRMAMQGNASRQIQKLPHVTKPEINLLPVKPFQNVLTPEDVSRRLWQEFGSGTSGPLSQSAVQDQDNSISFITQPRKIPPKFKVFGQSDKMILHSVTSAQGWLAAGAAQHKIKAEYRENFQVESVWLHGVSLTVSSQMCVRTICFLCGSAGKHEFLYCNVCCEPFHEFCLEEEERPHEINPDDWCCKNCQCCNVCGYQNNLLQCDKCQNTYHPQCLGPYYPTKPSKKKNIWICTKCVKCKSCGATTPGSGSAATWTYDFQLCYECGQLMDKGNFCPMCHKCYSDDDWESKMVQCVSCESWVHARCEGLTDEMYERVSFLPEDVHYVCKMCSPVGRRHWELVLQDDFMDGLKSVFNTVTQAKCSQHLIHIDEQKVKQLEEKMNERKYGEALKTTMELEKSLENFVSTLEKVLSSKNKKIENEQPKTAPSETRETPLSLVADIVDKQKEEEPEKNDDSLIKFDDDEDLDETKSSEGGKVSDEEVDIEEICNDGETISIADAETLSAVTTPGMSGAPSPADSETCDPVPELLHTEKDEVDGTNGKSSSVEVLSSPQASLSNECSTKVSIGNDENTENQNNDNATEKVHGNVNIGEVQSDELSKNSATEVSNATEITNAAEDNSASAIQKDNATKEDVNESQVTVCDTNENNSNQIYNLSEKEIKQEQIQELENSHSTSIDEKINQAANGETIDLTHEKSVTFNLKSPSKGEVTPVKSSPLSLKEKRFLPGFIRSYPKDFNAIKIKLVNEEYSTVVEFSEDMAHIINLALNDPDEVKLVRKKATNSVRSMFVKQMEKCFPWFSVKACNLWDQNQNFPPGMLPEAVLPPFDDHTYAQWLKREELHKSPQPSPFKKVNNTPIKKLVPLPIDEDAEKVLSCDLEDAGEDIRRCILCWHYGDSDPNEAGRLLYVGQDDWVHINCALWSAEVYEEEHDGTLQNVQTALSRGRVMRCDSCQRTGATVGCCTRGCPANYHFMCARFEQCSFQEDKKVFCPQHKEKVDGELVTNNKFAVLRRVCVSMEDLKFNKKTWSKGLDPSSINVIIGSCTVEDLGRLIPISDRKDMLIPADFRSSRVFWSTQDIRKRCVYTCQIIEVKPESPKAANLTIKDITIIHDETHPDYVPLSQLNIPGINLFPEKSRSMSEGTDVINLSEESSLAHSFNSSADCEMLSSTLNTQNSSFQDKSNDSLSSSWPIVKKRRKSDTSLNLSVLSPNTLKLLNIKDPEKFKQTASKPVPSEKEDFGTLIKIADRLNMAACNKKPNELGTTVEKMWPYRRRSKSEDRVLSSPTIGRCPSVRSEGYRSAGNSRANSEERSFHPIQPSGKSSLEMQKCNNVLKPSVDDNANSEVKDLNKSEIESMDISLGSIDRSSGSDDHSSQDLHPISEEPTSELNESSETYIILPEGCEELSDEDIQMIAEALEKSRSEHTDESTISVESVGENLNCSDGGLNLSAPSDDAIPNEPCSKTDSTVKDSGENSECSGDVTIKKQAQKMDTESLAPTDSVKTGDFLCENETQFSENLYNEAREMDVSKISKCETTEVERISEKKHSGIITEDSRNFAEDPAVSVAYDDTDLSRKSVLFGAENCGLVKNQELHAQEKSSVEDVGENEQSKVIIKENHIEPITEKPLTSSPQPSNELQEGHVHKEDNKKSVETKINLDVEEDSQKDNKIPESEDNQANTEGVNLSNNGNTVSSEETLSILTQKGNCAPVFSRDGRLIGYKKPVTPELDYKRLLYSVPKPSFQEILEEAQEFQKSKASLSENKVTETEEIDSFVVDMEIHTANKSSEDTEKPIEVSSTSGTEEESSIKSKSKTETAMESLSEIVEKCSEVVSENVMKENIIDNKGIKSVAEIQDDLKERKNIFEVLSAGTEEDEKEDVNVQTSKAGSEEISDLGEVKNEVQMKCDSTEKDKDIKIEDSEISDTKHLDDVKTRRKSDDSDKERNIFDALESSLNSSEGLESCVGKFESKEECAENENRSEEHKAEIFKGLGLARTPDAKKSRTEKNSPLKSYPLRRRSTQKTDKTSDIPLHDQIALKIKAESLAKSSPGEKGPFKCPTCKRMYRTEESFNTHVKSCDFEVSTSDEEETESECEMTTKKYSMRQTTVVKKVVMEIEQKERESENAARKGKIPPKITQKPLCKSPRLLLQKLSPGKYKKDLVNSPLKKRGRPPKLNKEVKLDDNCSKRSQSSEDDTTDRKSRRLRHSTSSPSDSTSKQSQPAAGTKDQFSNFEDKTSVMNCSVTSDSEVECSPRKRGRPQITSLTDKVAKCTSLGLKHRCLKEVLSKRIGRGRPRKYPIGQSPMELKRKLLKSAVGKKQGKNIELGKNCNKKFSESKEMTEKVELKERKLEDVTPKKKNGRGRPRKLPVVSSDKDSPSTSNRDSSDSENKISSREGKDDKARKILVEKSPKISSEINARPVRQRKSVNLEYPGYSTPSYRQKETSNISRRSLDSLKSNKQNLNDKSLNTLSGQKRKIDTSSDSVKRGRGRPPKKKPVMDLNDSSTEDDQQTNLNTGSELDTTDDEKSQFKSPIGILKKKGKNMESSPSVQKSSAANIKKGIKQEKSKGSKDCSPIVISDSKEDQKDNNVKKSNKQKKNVKDSILTIIKNSNASPHLKSPISDLKSNSLDQGNSSEDLESDSLDQSNASKHLKSSSAGQNNAFTSDETQTDMSQEIDSTDEMSDSDIIFCEESGSFISVEEKRRRKKMKKEGISVADVAENTSADEVTQHLKSQESSATQTCINNDCSENISAGSDEVSPNTHIVSSSDNHSSSVSQDSNHVVLNNNPVHSITDSTNQCKTIGECQISDNPGHTKMNSVVGNPGHSRGSDGPVHSQRIDNPGQLHGSDNPGQSQRIDNPGHSHGSDNPGHFKRTDCLSHSQTSTVNFTSIPPETTSTTGMDRNKSKSTLPFHISKGEKGSEKSGSTASGDTLLKSSTEAFVDQILKNSSPSLTPAQIAELKNKVANESVFSTQKIETLDTDATLTKIKDYLNKKIDEGTNKTLYVTDNDVRGTKGSATNHGNVMKINLPSNVSPREIQKIIQAHKIAMGTLENSEGSIGITPISRTSPVMPQVGKVSAALTAASSSLSSNSRFLQSSAPKTPQNAIIQSQHTPVVTQGILGMSPSIVTNNIPPYQTVSSSINSVQPYQTVPTGTNNIQGYQSIAPAANTLPSPAIMTIPPPQKTYYISPQNPSILPVPQNPILAPKPVMIPPMDNYVYNPLTGNVCVSPRSQGVISPVASQIVNNMQYVQTVPQMMSSIGLPSNNLLSVGPQILPNQTVTYSSQGPAIKPVPVSNQTFPLVSPTSQNLQSTSSSGVNSSPTIVRIFVDGKPVAITTDTSVLSDPNSILSKISISDLQSGRYNLSVTSHKVNSSNSVSTAKSASHVETVTTTKSPTKTNQMLTALLKAKIQSNPHQILSVDTLHHQNQKTNIIRPRVKHIRTRFQNPQSISKTSVNRTPNAPSILSGSRPFQTPNTSKCQNNLLTSTIKTLTPKHPLMQSQSTNTHLDKPYSISQSTGPNPTKTFYYRQPDGTVMKKTIKPTLKSLTSVKNTSQSATALKQKLTNSSSTERTFSIQPKLMKSIMKKIGRDKSVSILGKQGVNCDISVKGKKGSPVKKIMKQKRKTTLKPRLGLPHTSGVKSHPIIHPNKEMMALPQPAQEEEVREIPLSQFEHEQREKQTEAARKDGPHFKYKISSDDGFTCTADTMSDAWQQVVEKVQDVRSSAHMKNLSFINLKSSNIFGVNCRSVVYLLEQLFGAQNCRNYKFKFHKYDVADKEEEPAENASGCIRTEPYQSRKPFDIFSFLMSQYRHLPEFSEQKNDVEMFHKSSRRATSMDLPMAMRFRKLKEHSREAVGVYRSSIHGRGLFCKRNIDEGEMVIEYSGEVIRASLTDKREKYYESKGIGCYMFRIDDYDVIDATLHGSAARFINHSCEPNCYSRVINVDGKKHIVIFAMTTITRGEELTYDYKFPIEEIKIPCTCGAKKCRKYLN